MSLAVDFRSATLTNELCRLFSGSSVCLPSSFSAERRSNTRCWHEYSPPFVPINIGHEGGTALGGWRTKGGTKVNGIEDGRFYCANRWPHFMVFGFLNGSILRETLQPASRWGSAAAAAGKVHLAPLSPTPHNPSFASTPPPFPHPHWGNSGVITSFGVGMKALYWRD